MFEVILYLIMGIILISIGIHIGATSQKRIDEEESNLLSTARKKGYYLSKLDINDYFE
jgi:hypothetical protein